MEHAERRQITVVFCDLAGSTRLSNALDPEDYRVVINAYKSVCRDVVARHDGFVARFIGDGALIYFGFPQSRDTDAERAVECALQLGAGIAAARPQIVDHDIDLAARIGIATGLVVLEVNDDTALAVGSVPNLAARLQEIVEPGQVAVSDATRRLLGGLYRFDTPKQAAIDGFGEPVTFWLAGPRNESLNRFRALRGAYLTPYVGRRAEHDAVDDWWRRCEDEQHGRAIHVWGEAGIGKSRFVDAVAARLEERCFVLGFYCSPHHVKSALYPVIEYTRRESGIGDEATLEGKRRRLLDYLAETSDEPEKLAPFFELLLGFGTDETASGIDFARRQSLLRELAARIPRRARQQPVLMLCEDIHWMDSTTAELLRMVRDSIHDVPVLLVTTGREPPAVESALDYDAVIAMPPLDEAGAMEMISRLAGTSALNPEIAAEIARKTDGIPLYIEDLTRLVSGLDLEPSRILDRLKARETLPASLNDTLMERVDLLDRDKHVIQVAATVGRKFTTGVLADATGLDRTVLEASLGRLAENGMLVRNAERGDEYWFRHALLQDAAYNSLLKGERALLHARIARALVGAPGTPVETEPDLLAFHFDQAGDVDRAIEWYLAAAAKSSRIAAFLDARSNLQRVLELVEQSPARTRIEVRLKAHLGMAAANAALYGFSSIQAGESCREALAICRSAGDRPEMFPILSNLGSYHITRAEFPECFEYARECLDLAGRQATLPPRVYGHRMMGGVLFLTGDVEAAIDHLQQCVRLYDEMPRRADPVSTQDHKSTACCYLGLAYLLLGRYPEALDAAESGLAHSRALGDPHTINFSLTYLAAIHSFRGDDPQTREVARESIAVSEKHGFGQWRGISSLILGEYLVSRGDAERGMPIVMQGVEGHSSTDARAYMPFAISLLVKSLLRIGRFDEAGGALQKAFAILDASGENWYRAELLRLRAAVEALRGDRGAALATTEQALAVARDKRCRFWELQSATLKARLEAEGGNRDAALGTLSDAAITRDMAGATRPERVARDVFTQIEAGDTIQGGLV